MSVKIILADDHQAIRLAQRCILEKEPDFEIVAEARNGEEAIQCAEQHRADIVIMDINMPVLNGIEATRRLHQSHPEIKVIAFSLNVSQAFVRAMLKSGASGYVAKQSAVTELSKAIRAVQKDRVYVSPGTHGSLIDEIRRADKNRASMQLVN